MLSNELRSTLISSISNSIVLIYPRVVHSNQLEIMKQDHMNLMKSFQVNTGILQISLCFLTKFQFVTGFRSEQPTNRISICFVYLENCYGVRDGRTKSLQRDCSFFNSTYSLWAFYPPPKNFFFSRTSHCYVEFLDCLRSNFQSHVVSRSSLQVL